MVKPSWSAYFMEMLPAIAARSCDPNTKCSCVIVGPDHEIRSTGYNGMPRGIVESADRLERPEKYFWIEHAERNAIYNAARCGTSLAGCTMYLSWVPCMDCARAIAQAGIAVLVCDKATTDARAGDPRWKPDFDRSTDLLREAGVRVYWA